MAKDKDQTKNEQAKAEAAARVTKARVATTSDQTVEGDQPTDKELADTQFPALAGAPEVEIAKRSQGSEGLTDTRFRKTFIILPAQGVDEDARLGPEDDFQAHEARKLAVLEQAIQQGLHPDAEPTFDGSELHGDGVSVQLHYSVAVTPASVDDGRAVTPYRVLNERLDGSTDNAEANKNEAEVTRESARPTE